MPHERNDTPRVPGTRHLSEDDSDEAGLHRIIREETDRQAAPPPERARENGGDGQRE